jgi:hypothetical protein
MDTNFLGRKFVQIGARLKLAGRARSGVTLDIQTDRRGEFFAIAPPLRSEASVEVLDVQPADRHLLLLVREQDAKHKFLCGHDERHWFVAAIPELAPVGTVRQAKEALKPREVVSAQNRAKLAGRKRERRKNAAYFRQGEWFFLPYPDLVVDEVLVLGNEPLQRGGGKPHWAEFCYRSGGQTVHVCARHPNGVTPHEYRRILQHVPAAKKWDWRIMRRNPGVYVRGRIRHADHKTILLRCWHQVVMNTEHQARAMRNVAFLD